MHEPIAPARGFLLDMDGTFYLGNRLLAGALQFLDALTAQRKQYLFLTNNSSKNRREYAQKFSRLGLPIPATKILTSGEATASYVRRAHPGASVFLVGTAALDDDFREQGIRLTTEAPDVVVLGFDTTLTYGRLWRLCDLVRAGVPYIATHADINCPTEVGFMPDVGSIIALVRASTGREPDVVVGKPNRIIVEVAAEKMGLPVGALAMVGDRLYTDIALGQTLGIPTVLILSGETRREDLESSPFRPDYVFDDLAAVSEWLLSLG